MALTFLEVKAMIDAGQAEPSIQQFIRFALQKAVEARANDRPTLPEQDNAMVAAMALQKLLETPDGRRALNLSRRPRGKAYDADKLLDESPWAMALGISVSLGHIPRTRAREALGNWLAQQDKYPDAKTLESLVDDLAKRMEHHLEMVTYFRRVSGGDAATLSDIQMRMDAVLGKEERHDDK
jgi:hypothetical protein